jgi:hypothetical protein
MLLSAWHCADEINTDVMRLFTRLEQRGDYSMYNSSTVARGLRVACTPAVQVSMGIH